MTVRNVAGLLGLLLGGTIGTSTSAQEPAGTAKRCLDGRWSPPRELRTPDGYTVFMERPSIVPVGGKAFFVSFPAVTRDSLGGRVWPLVPGGAVPRRAEQIAMGVLVSARGEVQLVPAPADLAVTPLLSKGAVDDRGIAHVVWGSNDSTPISSFAVLRSLWYARFDGRRWSTPTRILTSQGTLMWNPSNSSPLVARGRTLHVLVFVQGEGLRHLRSDGGVWTNRHVEIPSSYAGYPHLVELRNGRLVLLVQGGVPHPGTSGMSAVFTTRSDDGGASWSPMVQISDSTAESAYDLRLLADERDVLYALWYQQTDEQGNPALSLSLGGSPGRIHVARSADRGVTWRRFPPTPLLPNANELQVLLRPDHSVLAAVVDGSGEQMLVTSWSGTWAPFLTVEAKPSPFNPSLGVGGAQRPFLAWGVRRTHDWVGTVLTRLLPCS
jgi:hypothetical protein